MSKLSRAERHLALNRLLNPDNAGDREHDLAASISQLYDQLDLQPGSGNGVRRAPGFSSVPPLSLHVLTMLDDRSQVGSPCVWFDPHPTGFGDDYTRPHSEEQNPPRAIGKALSGLVDGLREELDPEPIGPVLPDGQFLSSHQRTVPALCRWLFSHLEHLVDHPDVEEIHTDLQELSDQLRKAIGDGPPDPIGQCIELVKDRRSHELRYCGADLFLPPPRPDDPTQSAAEIAREVVTTCSSCHRKYRRLDLVRVKVAQVA